MQKRDFVTCSAITLVTSLITLGCTQTALLPNIATSTNGVASEDSIELTLSVATSVQDAMREVQTFYETENPHVSLIYNFGSSGSLAQQIAQGAPTDVFLSASKKWMDDLESQGQILEGSRQDLLLNALVMVTPLNQALDGNVTDFSDFATDAVNRIAIGEPESVPAGRYAKEALTSLNVFDALQSKMVFTKDVRQVLSYVETGNVDAGIVYATDAKVSDRVHVITTAAAETHSPIVYPVGIVADTEKTDAAQGFIDFLSGEEAIAIFEHYGFTMAD